METKNIVTVTFNPAIDKTTSVERMVPEHKMRAAEPTYYAGGGGVNIARALRKLGFRATAVYFEGGSTGEFYSSLLVKEDIQAVPVGIKRPTRENFIVDETSTGKQFRFGLPGPVVSSAELESFLNVITEIPKIDYLVISGSLTPGIPLTVFQTLRQIADKKNAKLVADTSGEALKSALACGLYLIKPSLSEMANLAGNMRLNEKQAVKAAKEIVASGKCEVIVISMGGDGAIMVTAERVIRAVAPPVSVISTVGAGDSMLAGILLNLAKKENLEAALQYGIACGTAATLNPGTNLCDKRAADKLLKVIRDV